MRKHRRRVIAKIASRQGAYLRFVRRKIRSMARAIGVPVEDLRKETRGVQ